MKEYMKNREYVNPVYETKELRTKFSFIKASLIVIALVLILNIITCHSSHGESDAYGGALSVFLPETFPDEVEIDGDGSQDKTFYFSYDDSASVAAVNLAKEQLNNNALPPTQLARPWEYLSFENFDSTDSSFTALGIFKVSMGLKKRSVMNEPDEYRLGVHVIGPEKTKVTRKNVVITLVVDVSGSMDSSAGFSGDSNNSYSLLELVKSGLELLPDSLKDGDIVNLITFNSHAVVIAQGISHANLATSFTPEINNLVANGGTDLNSGITKGYEVAWSTYDSNKSNRLIMLTDAYANIGEVDSSVVAGHTEHNNAEGVFFSGLGIGAGFNEAFLNELTERGKGAYFSLITKADAAKVFGEGFVALVSVAAQKVKFRLDYPAKFTRKSTASEESSENSNDVQDTNFSYNTSQYFYEVFTSDTSPTSTDKFKITIYYEDPTNPGTTLSPSLEDTVETMTGSNVEDKNISDAEAVYLLNQVIGKKIEPSEATDIFSTYYSSCTSNICIEYKELIEKYSTISKL